MLSELNKLLLVDLTKMLWSLWSKKNNFFMITTFFLLSNQLK